MPSLAGTFPCFVKTKSDRVFCLVIIYNQHQKKLSENKKPQRVKLISVTSIKLIQFWKQEDTERFQIRNVGITPLELRWSNGLSSDLCEAR